MIARVRAIEEGLPILRSANNGVSATIDPYGRVLGMIPLNARNVLDIKLPVALPDTPYVLLGDVTFLVLLLVMFVRASFPLRGRRP